jgi:prophage regulatory protein
MKTLLGLDRLRATFSDTSKSWTYENIKNGLLPPGVPIGQLRASGKPSRVGWPSDEIEKILEARIAGRSDGEIRELVASLVAARNQNERKDQ